MIWFLSKRSKGYLQTCAQKKPAATADIMGSDDYPDIKGTADFYQTKDGVLLCAEVIGLPSQDNPCTSGIFAFHLHEGTSCTGSAEEPFANAKGHYNPDDCRHPDHAGDLPPLFETKGRAFMVLLTGRFTVDEVIGRTLILHAKPDDFTSQPSGNAGKRIACGVIKR